MLNPMLNEDFLLKLEKERNREVYARIILLDVNELPIEAIEGKVTSGSINIDGTSSVRRSCSLQLVSKDINIHDFYWGLKNKFTLEVGLLNDIDADYPEIIWFKQGVYVITAFSASLGVNNYTISISGKDKMCLLNGDMAGHIMNISEDFGVKWYWQNDEHTEYIAEDIEIKEIIYKGVQTYAGELPQNIIINDIAECGVQLMEYRGKQPLYLIKNNDDKIYENMTVNGNMKCWYKDKGKVKQITLSQIPKYEKEISTEINQDETTIPTVVYFEEPTEKSDQYTIYKVVGGTGAIGYRLTNLTYAGELMAQAGDAFTTILDKIVDMLGNFEYFYDLDGHFVFQKKKNYITSKWTGLTGSSTDEENITYTEDNTSNDTFSYIFDGNYLITSFSSQPALANMRNDFSAWGVRTSATGAEIPIHMRMAIDHKPWYYKSFDGTIYVANTKKAGTYVDWRELIYRMALDYYNHNIEDDFYVKLRENNVVELDGEKIQLYPNGKTGYERYYTDMEAFWRQLYTPIEENKEFSNGIITNEETDVKERKDKYYIWDKTTDPPTCITYNFLDAVVMKTPEADVNYKINTVEYLGYNPMREYYLLKDSQLRLSSYDETSPIFMIESYDAEDASRITKPSVFANDMKPLTEIKVPEKGKTDYCKLAPGDITKGIQIGEKYLTFHRKEKQYSIDTLVDKVELDNVEVVYALATIDESGVPHATNEDIVATNGIVSLVSKDKDVITIGAFIHQGKQLTEAENKDLIEKQELLLKTADDILEPVQKADGSYYYWQIDTNNIQCYESYSFVYAFTVGSAEDPWGYAEVLPEGATDKKRLINTLKIGTDYDIFCKYPPTDDKDKQVEKLDKIKVDTKSTSGPYKLYVEEEGYLEKKNVIVKFPISGSALTCEYYDDGEWKTMYIYTYRYTGANYVYYKSEITAEESPWNPLVSTNPELLNFWIDFIDPEASGLEKYAVSQIGPRPKVVNENSVKAIYYREVPNILFEETRESEFSHQPGYTYIYLNDALKNLFVMSGQGVSAKDKIEELLNNYTFMSEGIQISGVPIYRLDANTRISVKDVETGISGEYIISRISLPLGHNGTMSITASKAVELIY